jgi:two-component system NtrC family sensor kinase
MPSLEKLRERVVELTFERDHALLHVRLNQLLQKGLDAILSSDTLEDTFAKFFGVMAEGVQFDSAVLLRLEPDHFSLIARQNAPDWPEQAELGSATLVAALSGRHAVAVFNLMLLPEWGDQIITWWPQVHSALFQRIQTRDQQFLLILGSGSVAAFGPSEEKIVGQFISFVASTIASVENKKLYMISQSLKERQQRIEQSLMQSEKMASLGQLAAGVAHELNNPIGFLLSNIHMFQTYLNIFKSLLHNYQLLCDEQQSEQVKQQAKQQLGSLYQKENVAFLLEDSDTLIADSVEGAMRVRDIVQSLRRFSHPDTDQIELVNLNDSVESTIKIISGEIKHSLLLKKQLCADALYVMGKSNQISQVFLNIMMNARQAITHDHGELIISSGVSGQEAWVSLEDNGSGIAPQHISRLFEPFFTTKDVGKGTGLGLSLCHSIMLQHSGRINVQSELGVFSRFTLYFPLAGLS